MKTALTILSIIVLSAIILFLNSCSPEKRLNKLLAAYPELSVHDTTFVKDTFRTPATTIQVKETRYIHDTTIRKGNETIKIVHDTVNKIITITADCLPDTVYIRTILKVNSTSPIPIANEGSTWSHVKSAFFWIGGFILALILLLIIYAFVPKK